MSKKRAFVRYTKSGEIVPGSLIITTNGGYPDKSSLWQEISVDKCCPDVGGCDSNKEIILKTTPPSFIEGGILTFYCNEEVVLSIAPIDGDGSFITIFELIQILNTFYSQLIGDFIVDENGDVVLISNECKIKNICPEGVPSFSLGTLALPNPNN